MSHIVWCYVLALFSVYVECQDNGIRWFTGDACNCNGRSSRCFFDEELYQRTGHGGHCLDCTGNTDGPNCERCKTNYYLTEQRGCQPCRCNEEGSRSFQCNTEGKCQCKEGVGGEKCDVCLPNHYGFGRFGCKACGCEASGSVGEEPTCDALTGDCLCKDNVEGKGCDMCKPGYFNLDRENKFGCTPCFCFGHASVCKAAPGYAKTFIESEYIRGSDRWKVVDIDDREYKMEYNAITKSIGLRAEDRETLYFTAPSKFLGDQRASYNQKLVFRLRIGEQPPRESIQDIVIEGFKMRITAPIFSQNNPRPTYSTQEYSFVLHENREYGWTPRLNAKDFLSILSNVTAIKIRGNYGIGGVGFLESVSLHTARRGAIGRPASWIEMCTCPEGYVGQYCENCSPGYRYDPPNGDSFARCVPCNCNGHAHICDTRSGRCICQHHTTGDTCELCSRGFYGNALQGTPTDCQPCPCPNRGACIQLADGTVACLECPVGYAGARCDLCTDGFFGDPAGTFGTERDCQKCYCNENIDTNAVGNCNRTTGECLKCVYNTAGFHCDECEAGYYGDALSSNKGDCKACRCSPLGSEGLTLCDQLTGQCECKPYVTGRQCDRCVDEFFNLRSGEGCEPCNCNTVGSYNQTCDAVTGQCFCREGVVGVQCDQCEVEHYGFSYEGCKPCECDTIGSVSLQCDRDGQCPCRENVEGRQCNLCKENKHNRQAGCIDCAPCYNLVQDEVDIHRVKLQELEYLLSNITSAPAVVDDEDFERKLAQVEDRVDRLWTDAKIAVNAGEGRLSLTEQLENLRKRLDEVRSLVERADQTVNEAGQRSEEGEQLITIAEETIIRAQEEIKNTKYYLETDGMNAFLEAVEKSKEFGQQSQRMSEIAREARELADSHEEQAEDIENIAKQAKKKSTEAYELAKTAVEEQQQVSNDISKLQAATEEAERWLKQTNLKAVQAQHESGEAFKEALETLTSATSLIIPESGKAVVLQEKAEDIATEAERIKQLASELLQTNTQLLDKLDERIEEAEELLQSGIGQQQIADEMLIELDVAAVEADKAVEKGEKTLKDAQKTLETLREFGKGVQESKGKAEEALKLIKQITELIESAERKTWEASSALDGAVEDATVAKTTAVMAENMAKDASQEADRIRIAAETTKIKASEMNDEANYLGVRVIETNDRITQLENQADTEEQLAGTALKKANEAKVSAQEAQRKVEAALQDVEDIATALRNLQDINTKQLEELERKLEQAERELEAAGLDQKMAELRQARSLQNTWMEDYEEELRLLRIEVNNIEDISTSLPDGCFQRLKLEP